MTRGPANVAQWRHAIDPAQPFISLAALQTLGRGAKRKSTSVEAAGKAPDPEDSCPQGQTPRPASFRMGHPRVTLRVEVGGLTEPVRVAPSRLRRVRAPHRKAPTAGRVRQGTARNPRSDVGREHARRSQEPIR